MVKLGWDLFRTSVFIISLFMLGDYYGHMYLESHQSLQVVPTYYFVNKLLYGVPLFIGGLYVASLLGFTDFKKPLITTALVVLGLQFQYWSMYDVKFNLMVMGLHAVVLFPIAYFSDYKKWLTD